MQNSFLNIYPQLIEASKPQSATSLAESNNADVMQQSSHSAGLNTSGLWLAHGDEPLLQQWLVDPIRSIWRAHNLAIQRIDLVSAKTWQEVLGELNSLSLFDDATAVIVSGNHKPDKAVQTALESFAIEANSGGNQNSVLWLTGKIDKRAQSSKWFTPFAKYGNVVDCNLYNENQRQQLLAYHAQRFGLNLNPEAWQFLMVQTEHHLLSAYQALWRLSYLFTPDITATANDNSSAPNGINSPIQPISIGVEELKNALVSNAQYSVFDLSDAMLAGNAAQVVKIIQQLKTTDEPTPLVLWALSKDMRLIMQLMGGEDPQSLGIWRNKQSIYHAACQRQTLETIADWSDILYQCDKAVKGVIKQPAWELILQAALRVTGHRLFA